MQFFLLRLILLNLLKLETSLSERELGVTETMTGNFPKELGIGGDEFCICL